MCWTCLSSKRVFSVVMVLLAMVGLLPPRAHGQTDRPWEHPAGPACFELWFQTSISRLNVHNGSAGFNGVKPYTVSPWGLIVGTHQAQDRAPDNWGEFGGNKYWWLWAHFTKSPNWGSNSEWNAAGVPMPRPFILDCIAKGGPGATGVGPAGGGAGTVTAPGPTAPTAVPQELRSGPWLFGRTSGARAYGSIEFTTSWEPRIGAYRIGGSYRHDNESYWRMDGSDLLLIHRNGTVSSRLHRVNANRWEGPFLLPGGSLTHYIARAGTAGTGTSGTGSGGGDESAGGKAIERGMNRFGGDYRSIVFGPEHCRDLCDQDPQCRAWTFVKPGVQGEHARCWLKSSVPAARPDTRTTSGVKGAP